MKKIADFGTSPPIYSQHEREFSHRENAFLKTGYISRTDSHPIFDRCDHSLPDFENRDSRGAPGAQLRRKIPRGSPYRGSIWPKTKKGCFCVRRRKGSRRVCFVRSAPKHKSVSVFCTVACYNWG